MTQLNNSMLSEEQLLTGQIFEHSSDLISVHSNAGVALYVSPASKQLLGFETEQLIGMNFLDLLHPRDRQILKKLSLSNDQIKSIACRLRRREGDYIWLHTIITPIEDSSSPEKKFLCISRDVTKFKLLEEEMKQKMEKYKLLIEHTHDTIGFISLSGVFIYINETGKKLLGATGTKEIIGRTIYEFIAPDDRQKLKKRISSIKKKDATTDSIEATLIRMDQERKYIDLKIIPTIYKGRKTKQVIIRDITERKLTEEKLQQTEKLSVVGHLSAGIAHEIRNPLTSIKGFTQLLKEDLDSHYLDVMLSELNRIDKIVSDLLILAKPQIEHFEATNLNKLIKDIVSLLSTQAILKNIEIITLMNGNDFIIDCEPDKLKQVLINIVKNAIESMSKDGKIYINMSWLNENEVTLQIADEGVGIPEERLSKLGEPFYSTKEKGTGLGLMICKQIIESHNGSINITSKVNRGTVVEIRLPKVQQL